MDLKLVALTEKVNGYSIKTLSPLRIVIHIVRYHEVDGKRVCVQAMTRGIAQRPEGFRGLCITLCNAGEMRYLRNLENNLQSQNVRRLEPSTQSTHGVPEDWCVRD